MGDPVAMKDGFESPDFAACAAPAPAADLTLCDSNVLPPRYARNGSLTTAPQQARLLRGRVLLVGLGGLGGHVLDGLVRMGVGTIVGVDGDCFEESNLNRQLLCTLDTLGQSKALVAQDYVRRLNRETDFIPVPYFVRGAALRDLLRVHAPLDIVVDALGGLDDRQALHCAAQEEGIPVVTAGIAGLTGWVQVLRPGDKGPMHYFGQDPSPAPSGASASTRSTASTASAGSSVSSAEQVLGNLSPTVMVAAGVQCSQVYTLLTRNACPQEMLLFDLQDSFFQLLR